MDLQEAFDAGFEAVKTYVERSFDAFEARLIEIEKRSAVPGRDGRDGIDGKDGPAGRDGVNGIDGVHGKDGVNGTHGKDAKQVTLEQVVEAVKSMPDAIALAVADYIAANPPAAGKDGDNGAVGKDGVDGLNGSDGVDGKDGHPGMNGSDGKSVSIEDVLPIVNEAVQRSVSAIEIPRGEKGEPGRDGVNGEPGICGERGDTGKDGVGLAGSIIDRSGNLIVTLTDGSTRELGLVVGKDGGAGRDGVDGLAGVDGTNGADGIGFDDLDLVETEDGLSLQFSRGDVVKSFALPVPLDRGVWKEKEYRKGAGVTWGGSFWIAQRDTNAKPDTQDSGWRLSVKKGRDGREVVSTKIVQPVKSQESVKLQK